MNIIQIVGYKNSGKTTLTTKLVQTLDQKGIHTASLKHHGHGGIPVGLENTDSFRQQRAGAMIAGVEGEGVFQLTHQTGWKLEQLIAIYELFDIDVLVIEGFKKATFPKIVLIQAEDDLYLLNEIENIVAVVTDVECTVPYQTFSYDQFEEVCQFYIVHYLTS